MKSNPRDLFCRVPGCELKNFRFKTKEALRSHTIRKHPLPEEARTTAQEESRPGNGAAPNTPKTHNLGLRPGEMLPVFSQGPDPPGKSGRLL